MVQCFLPIILLHMNHLADVTLLQTKVYIVIIHTQGQNIDAKET